MATWYEELTHLKRPWCWKRLKAGGEGDDRGWDGWMATPTQWTWVWVDSGIWWWTGRPGVLWFTGLQRVRHDWVTELNWTWYYQGPLRFGSCLPLHSIACYHSPCISHYRSRTLFSFLYLSIHLSYSVPSTGNAWLFVCSSLLLLQEVVV